MFVSRATVELLRLDWAALDRVNSGIRWRSRSRDRRVHDLEYRLLNGRLGILCSYAQLGVGAHKLEDRRPDFWRIIQAHGDTICSDIRDRLYALIDLAHFTNHGSRLHIDYSLPEHQLLVNAYVCLCRTAPHVPALQCGKRLRHVLRLNHVRLDFESTWRISHFNKPTDKQSDGTFPVTQLDARTMTVRGWHRGASVSSLDDIVSRSLGDSIPLTYLRERGICVGRINKTRPCSSPSDSPNPSRQALEATHAHSFALEEGTEAFGNFKEESAGHSSTLSCTIEAGRAASTARPMSLIESHCIGREPKRDVRSGCGGHQGWTSDGVSVGDIVCLCPQAWIFLVLRRILGNPAYKVIGRVQWTDPWSSEMHAQSRCYEHVIKKIQDRGGPTKVSLFMDPITAIEMTYESA